jgi:hypothetical protein
MRVGGYGLICQAGQKADEAFQELKSAVADIKESVVNTCQHCFLVFVLTPGQTTTCGCYQFLRVERAMVDDDSLNCLPIHLAR